MSDQILNYLTSLDVAGLAAGAFIEAMGLPFPGGLMIIFAGFLVDQGRLNLFLAFLSAFAGFTAGSLVAFHIGRYFGVKFLERYGHYLKITRERLDRTRSWLNRSAAGFIILGRFVPWVSNVTPYMAGISNLSVTHFLVYNSIYTFLWGSVYLTLGVFFGQYAGVLVDFARKHLSALALLGLLAYLFFFWFKKQGIKNKIFNKRS